MSRSAKLFIGLFSFLPIVLLIVFFIMFMYMFPAVFEWKDHEDPDPGEVFSVFGPIIMLGLIMGILSLGLLVFFIMHLVRNKSMDTTERIVWVLVLLFAGIVGYPIYWYMRIWKDEPASL